ncbi:MAG: aspartate aminotransferase family protein [Candidatus Anaerobiospirillum merdipullorum]|uniref:Aspartate aminotransferase family protein n=1 Tax=Candidatus Anaerobiospirillum merdipullorum TaxID=2838450 RepID=A0A9E2NRK9_9GAMM|nr:aspartate aminotransferase family protein [Candidatus Anaerobiospirillum merdipullorum]
MDSPSIAQVLRDDATYIASYQHIAELPLVVKSAHGSYLVDVAGKEYLDFTSGACTMSLGYDPIPTGDFGSFPFPYATGVAQVAYAKALAQHYPAPVAVKVGFGICGSEANDGAIKLCRAYTRRKKIVSFSGDYHGTTFGAVSLTTIPGRISNKFDPLLPEVYILPFCAQTASKEEIDHCLNSIAALDYSTIAGFIVEPVQGDMGMLPIHPQLMQALYALCQQYGIALVVDEVQMALGRTGKFFSIENYPGVIPDAIVMGKTIGGGIPLSAILGKAEFMDSLGPCEHAFSMAGTSEACARGLQLLHMLEQPKFQAGLQERCTLLLQGLRTLQERHPAVVSQITGLGYAFALWLKSNQALLDDNEATRRVISRCFANGLYLMRLGANWLRIEPQFNIALSDLKRGLEIIDLALSDLESGRLN